MDSKSVGVDLTKKGELQKWLDMRPVKMDTGKPRGDVLDCAPQPVTDFTRNLPAGYGLVNAKGETVEDFELVINEDTTIVTW